VATKFRVPKSCLIKSQTSSSVSDTSISSKKSRLRDAWSKWTIRQLMESRLCSTRKKSKILTARQTLLWGTFPNSWTKKDSWNSSSNTERLVLANLKFSPMELAEVLVMFNSLNRRAQKMLSPVSMISRLAIAPYLLPSTPRKMREKRKVKSSLTCSLGTCL